MWSVQGCLPVDDTTDCSADDERPRPFILRRWVTFLIFLKHLYSFCDLLFLSLLRRFSNITGVIRIEYAFLCTPSFMQRTFSPRKIMSNLIVVIKQNDSYIWIVSIYIHPHKMILDKHFNAVGLYFILWCRLSSYYS